MHHLVIVSDFNTSNLKGLLPRAGDEGAVQAQCAPYGQVMQSLLAGSDLWGDEVDGAIVWTTPQAISESYLRRLEYQDSSLDEMAEDARTFGEALKRLPQRVRHIFVATWSSFHPSLSRRGLLDMESSNGLSVALMRMNLALAEATSSDLRIHLFDSSRWLSLCGDRAFDARLWYAAKTPYSLAVFKHAARDFCAALRGIEGRARKLLVLDLDGTLWDGTVGDDGWQSLRVGGHDPIGEAYRDFQAALHALTRRGVLLAIVSKNDEAVALEALTSHPEMLLRPKDFAGWRINWEDKAKNLLELVAELKLGLDAAVFIDDNPVERDRIRQALPDVYVPTWPTNPLAYRTALASLDCFDAPFVAAEDRARTAMYVIERERKSFQENAGSIEQWLDSLELVVEVDGLDASNLPRASQLLNKTNQMNLTTRRLSADGFVQWAAAPDHEVLVFKVKDKFGDYGLVGIGSLEFDPLQKVAHAADFVLSCRAMGRKVEESIWWVLEEAAKAKGAARLIAIYKPTMRNNPCLQFLRNSWLERGLNESTFTSDLTGERTLPKCIKLIWKAGPVRPERVHAPPTVEAP